MEPYPEHSKHHHSGGDCAPVSAPGGDRPGGGPPRCPYWLVRHTDQRGCTHLAGRAPHQDVVCWLDHQPGGRWAHPLVGAGPTLLAAWSAGGSRWLVPPCGAVDFLGG